MTELETERLLLRMFSPSDLDDLSTIFSDPEVVRYIGDGKPAPREETERALHSIINHWEQHGFGRWAAVHKPTRRLIGYGGLRSFNGTPELVYLLSKPYWGRGLATEMAKACIRFGFEDKGFGQVMAMAKVANVASHRVMEKAGMLFDRRTFVLNIEVICYRICRETFLSPRNAHRGSDANGVVTQQQPLPVFGTPLF